MGFIIIKVTYPNKKEADKSINNLFKKNLIASANLINIQSVSKWPGKIKQVGEIMVLLNTKKENWSKVKTEVKRTHPYKVPCIAKINAEANPDYEKWVNDETDSNP